MTTLFKRFATVAGLLVICLGSSTSQRSCSFFGSDRSGGGSGSLSFVTELRLQRSGGEVTDSFERDELIEMVLTVRNRLNRSVDVDFPTSRQSDFVVVRENTDNVVWKRSEGEPVTQGTTTLTFAAGETKTFTASWNQIRANGSRIERGTYEARGVLVFDGFDSDPLRSNQMGSSPKRFSIN